jgi:hypothetical protein
MLDPPRAPDSVEPDLAVAVFDGAQAPKGVVEAVVVENLIDPDDLVVGCGFP